jgi:beta-lactamase class A
MTMTPSLFETDAAVTRAGEALRDGLVARQAGDGLGAQDIAITLLVHDAPLAQRGDPVRPRGWSWRGDAPFYPCSVVKLFWLLACEAALEAGRIVPHPELDRAMTDMIRWSSNAATNYVVDQVTGTTGDTLLEGAEYDSWAAARNGVNRFLCTLGWPEIGPGVNVCQKAMDDDRYGRENQFVGAARLNHNSLTSDAAARLLLEVLGGRVLTPARCRSIAALMRRPLDPAWIDANPHGQVRGYLGAGLPAASRLWSKAGWTNWTGDATASYRRHDAAYVEAPGCPPFSLVVFTKGRAVSEDMQMLPLVARDAVRILSAL